VLALNYIFHIILTLMKLTGRRIGEVIPEELFLHADGKIPDADGKSSDECISPFADAIDKNLTCVDTPTCSGCLHR